MIFEPGPLDGGIGAGLMWCWWGKRNAGDMGDMGPIRAPPLGLVCIMIGESRLNNPGEGWDMRLAVGGADQGRCGDMRERDWRGCPGGSGVKGKAGLRRPVAGAEPPARYAVEGGNPMRTLVILGDCRGALFAGDGNGPRTPISCSGLTLNADTSAANCSGGGGCFLPPGGLLVSINCTCVGLVSSKLMPGTDSSILHIALRGM